MTPEEAITFSLASLSLIWKNGTVRLRMRCSGFMCCGGLLVTEVLRKVAFEVKEQPVALALLIPVER